MRLDMVSLIASAFVSVIFIIAKLLVDKADAKLEFIQVERAIKDIVIENKENDNVLELMLNCKRIERILCYK